MATPQIRKRQHADEPSRNLPSKKRRQDDRDPDDYLITWRYPPKYWDRLSKIELEQAALEELDRRNKRLSSPPKHCVPRTRAITRALARALARFASDGGPDLTDLRGYPDPNKKAMSSSSRTRATRSTKATTATSTTSKKSKTPYDRGFEQHLIDHDIHPSWDSQAPDLEDLSSKLAVPRPSLSPSQFSNGAFSNFQRTNAQAKDEEDVKMRVLPTIAGTTDQPSSMNTIFGNLAPLTDGSLAPAKPDVYYGAPPKDLDRSVRDELGPYIIPSTMEDKPLVPNFFIEIKGPDGSAAVMQRQARYDGAIGACGMHSLQNYGNDEPVYDGRPYTFSSTYHGGTGTLQLYTHHMTEPTTPGGRPEYHMTQFRGFVMTDSRETFVQGATAFRNARDVAKRHRDSFIQAANERAQRPGEENPAAADTAVVQQDEGSSPHEFVDCAEFPLDVIEEASGPHPQSFVGVGDRTPRQAIYKERPQYLADDDDDQQADSQSSVPFDLQDPEASVDTSFTSSFASSFTPSSHPPVHGYGSRPKRLRNPRSPPSEPHIAEDHHKTAPARPSKKKPKKKGT